MNLKAKLKILLLGYKATSESYLKKLRDMGAEIGEDVKMFRPYNTTIDVQDPHLLSIGDHVVITGPATILTHDYSWSVLKHKYGVILGNQRVTRIGSNVFIGWGSTILGGSIIGDNTIIGANSVVSGRLEGNAVYAGNPAKRIMSLDEYYQKREQRQLDEAVEYVLSYQRCHGVWPQPEKLHEYFFLFTKTSDSELMQTFYGKLKLTGNYEQTIETMQKRNPAFASYDEFIEHCMKVKEERKLNG